jgi:hypothetical protein
MLKHACRGLMFVMLMLGADARAAAAADSELYRIFLLDGAALVSFGEYARVADRVVFSMPVGAASEESSLQLVSIAESSVDWERTEQYTYAVRARRYIETRGDEDFALLGHRVTEALNDIRLTDDPARRLAMAEEARANLAKWPFENFGYRADEIGQLVSMLDDVIADLHAAAGRGVELRLAATTMPPPPVPLLPPPDLRATLEQALTAAGYAAGPAERVSLLQSIAAALKNTARTEAWTVTLGRRVSRELDAELRVDRAYSELAARTRTAAMEKAARADVGGVEALLRDALEADDRLGRKRPQAMASLLAVLDLRLDEARRMRLARDAWAARRALFAAYRRQIAPLVSDLRRAKGWLEEVRRLAGPDPGALGRNAQRVVMARRALDAVLPPPELAPAHGLYTSAFHMAERAAASRRNAVSSNDMNLAWQASSAAAGALMLLERADEELDRLAAAPRENSRQ